MTFLAPALLWSLLALIPLAAIYFLKVRPRKRPTTAYFLWERIFQEKRSNSLFQRLRDAWSLLLMLLAATAVCLALGRPEWSDERKDLLLVIDHSASMSAVGAGGARLELAKQEARQIILGLSGSQRAAVAVLGRQLHYCSHLSDNPQELLEAVDRIEPSADTLRLAALPTAAETKPASEPTTSEEPPASPQADPASTHKGDQSAAVAGVSDRHRVLFISDGGFEPRALPPGVELIKVGAAAENLGLVAADLAYLAGDTSRMGIYFQIASTYSEPRQVDLSLLSVNDEGHEQLQKVIPLTIQPGLNRPETFELAGAPAGRWLARLDQDDALAADNVAYLTLAKPEAISVSVESTDPYFLENSVQAFSRGESLLKLVTANAAVVLAKGTAPSGQLAVIFQPQGDAPWWTELGDETEAGAPRALAENHPVLRHLDATSIPFAGARAITPIAGAQILVADDRGMPLIYKARQGDRAAIVVNLDPVAAESYFSAWFPVLVHASVTHLAGRDQVLVATYHPGEPVPLPGGRDDITTTITLPQLASESTNQLHQMETTGNWFHGIDRLGFYHVENATGNYLVGASLLSSEESLLNSEQASDQHASLSRGRSPAAWLTLLGIVVLSAESILYHRRKVG